MSAGDSAARERLASYLVHPPFSLTRLHCDRDAGEVECRERLGVILRYYHRKAA